VTLSVHHPLRLAASVLAVWLLWPRGYLSTFMKVGTIALLAVGMCWRARYGGSGDLAVRDPRDGRCSPVHCSLPFHTSLRRAVGFIADLSAHPEAAEKEARCGIGYGGM
jgi:hypothetical protein